MSTTNKVELNNHPLGIAINKNAIRDVDALIEAIGVVIREFHFQVHRLDTMVESKGPREKQYHQELKKKYAGADDPLQTLRRYHVSRRQKLREKEANPYKD